jgi:Sec-independent protein secretion pathway component TatC
MIEQIQSMGIWEHVNELRKRLFKALLGMIAAVLVSFSLAPMFIEILSAADRRYAGLDIHRSN